MPWVLFFNQCFYSKISGIIMETIFTLQKAETKDHKYSSPALSMTTAISGLLTFGSTICLMVILLTALSGGDVREELFAAAVAAALLSGSVFVIS